MHFPVGLRSWRHVEWSLCFCTIQTVFCPWSSSPTTSTLFLEYHKNEVFQQHSMLYSIKSLGEIQKTYIVVILLFIALETCTVNLAIASVVECLGWKPYWSSKIICLFLHISYHLWWINFSNILEVDGSSDIGLCLSISGFFPFCSVSTYPFHSFHISRHSSSLKGCINYKADWNRYWWCQTV